MSLEIEIDPHGMSRVPFVDLRTRLLGMEERFTDRSLRLLPYPEIILSAMPNAGKAACTLAEAKRAKQLRRERFLSLSPDELLKAKSYLQKEGMYADISAAIQMRSAPTWDDLSPVARLWCKLNCLYTHIDLPDLRLKEATLLLENVHRELSLPDAVLTRISDDLDQLLWLYPEVIDSDMFRVSLGTLAEEVLHHLTSSEQAQCELVAGYHCTGHCYQAIGVNE